MFCIADQVTPHCTQHTHTTHTNHIHTLTTGALQQDRFFSELRAAPDGFGVVADALGRGLMDLTAAGLAARRQAAAAAAAGGGGGGGVGSGGGADLPLPGALGLL